MWKFIFLMIYLLNWFSGRPGWRKWCSYFYIMIPYNLVLSFCHFQKSIRSVWFSFLLLSFPKLEHFSGVPPALEFACSVFFKPLDFCNFVHFVCKLWRCSLERIGTLSSYPLTSRISSEGPLCPHQLKHYLRWSGIELKCSVSKGLPSRALYLARHCFLPGQWPNIALFPSDSPRGWWETSHFPWYFRNSPASLVTFR